MESSTPRRRDFVPTIRVYFTPTGSDNSSAGDPPSTAAMESSALEALDRKKVIDGTWRWIAEDTAQVTLERIGEAGAVIENADGLPVCGGAFALRLAYAPATDKVTLRNIDEKILVEDDRARRKNPADPPHLGLLHALGLLDGSHGSVAVEYLERGRGMGRLRFENAERAAEFVARAQSKKVDSGHSRVLYVDYDYGQRPGKKSHHRREGSRGDASDGSGSDGGGTHGGSGGGAWDSARDRRARGRSVTSTTRDAKRRQSREPDRSHGYGYTRRDNERSRSRGRRDDDDGDTDGDGDHAMGRRRSGDLRSRLTARRRSGDDDDMVSPKRARRAPPSAALSSPLADPTAMSTFMEGLRGMMGIVEQVMGGGTIGSPAAAAASTASTGPSVAHNGCFECADILHRFETHLRNVKHTADTPIDDIVKRTVAAYLDAHYEFEREDRLAEGTGWELTRRDRFRNEILNPFLSKMHFREWGKLDALWTKWFPAHILGGSKSWDTIRFRRKSREDND